MVLDEDTYRDNQLYEYLDKQSSYTLVSNCCGAIIYEEESDICPDCQEHCTIVTKGEYNTDLYEQAMEDRNSVS